MARTRMLFPAVLWRQRELFWRLTCRDVAGRYRGSAIGWGWTFLTPLLMLAVYTFVFSQVFKARWGGTGGDSGPIGFAMNLFAGLIAFNLCSESVCRAPDLIVSQPNYVKKVIFPLEVLPAVSVAAATIHAMSSLGILAIFLLITRGGIPHTAVLLPLVWTPLVLASLAISWILAATGVYLRDLAQVTGVTMSMLLFLSAVFYPLSALPERWQPVMRLNPLAIIIEQTRRVTLEGVLPDSSYIFIGTLMAVILCELAYRGFQRARAGFADVL